MDDLFIEVVRVGDERSVVVEELPGGTFMVGGRIYNGNTGDISNATIRFSEEALETLRAILNRRAEGKE